MLHSLDHVVVAVRDLAAASEQTASLLGRAPSWRGVHPGAGTANVLFRLEGGYLELLAPQGTGGLGALVERKLEESGEGMVALAFGTDDAEACAAAFRSAGLAALDPAEGEGRDLMSGALRRWRNVLLPPEATRGPWLFAIEHRTGSAPLPSSEVQAAPESCVSGLDHAVVWSGDLEASRSLYRDGLGLRLALDRSFEARGVRILFFRVGGVTVEVVGKVDAAAEPESGGADRFGGLAWRVPDADAARARLETAGLDVSEVRAGAKPGTRVCSVRGEPCGVPTLLIEPVA